MGGLATAAALKVGASAGTAAAVGKGVGIASNITGVVLPVVGALRAGEATDAQSDLEQSIAEGQAAQEELRVAEEERLRRKSGEELRSRQIAQFAKGGVRVGEGTPLLLLAETALDTEADIDAIQAGGKAKSSTFRRRGQTFRSIGKSAKSTSRLRAGTSLLSGINDLTRSNP